MLHELLSQHRQDLVTRCLDRRPTPRFDRGIPLETTRGVPEFLDQLINTLRADATGDADRRPAMADDVQIGDTATLYSRELVRAGFSIDQVVHHYGDVCQAIAELAIERGEAISGEELRTLNRLLDDAIASAVTEFGVQQGVGTGDAPFSSRERVGELAHELRNLLGTALFATSAIKSGEVGARGAVGLALDRSLMGMRDLIARTLANVRLADMRPWHGAGVSLEVLIEEIRIMQSMEAASRGVDLIVEPIDPGVVVRVDRDAVSSAIVNVVQNAIKFTARHHGARVVVRTRKHEGFSVIDVEDECGGLPPGQVEDLFQAFVQRDIDRTGVGLGLSITKRAIEASGGMIVARDLPGRGCIFTMTLPLMAVPEPHVVRTV